MRTCVRGRNTLGVSNRCEGRVASIVDGETAVVVAREFDGNHATRRLPSGGVAKVAHLYGNAPIVRERLIEIIAPDRPVFCWRPVGVGQGSFEGAIVVDEFVQPVHGSLQDQILTGDQ